MYNYIYIIYIYNKHTYLSLLKSNSLIYIIYVIIIFYLYMHQYVTCFTKNTFTQNILFLAFLIFN